MSARYDITADFLLKSGYRALHAGDDYNHTFSVEHPPGVPLSLTGAKIWLTIKESDTDSDAASKLQYSNSVPPQIQITDGPNGVFVVGFQATDTQDLAGSWLYDIQVRLSSLKILTVARGIIEFLPHITYSR